MNKILFIAPIEPNSRFKGGITSYAETIINNSLLFDKNHIEIKPMNNCIVDRKAGTNGKFSFLNVVNFLKTRKQIKKSLKLNNYNSIYLNTSYGLSLLKDLFTLKKTYRKKYHVFLHIHFADINNVLTANKTLRNIIIKQLKNKVTTIISLSKKLREDLIKLGFEEDKIKILYNYFDPNLPLIKKEDLVSKYAKHSKVTNFLFVGSLDKRKGFYDLIKVFKMIDNNNIKLTICGKPNDYYSQKIIDEIVELPYFTYSGYVSGEEKNKVFQESNVLILPSYGEGLPITILEALNFGLPIISTNVGSIPEIIDDKFGSVIIPGDINALKEKILSYSNINLYKKSMCSLNESKKYTFEVFSKKLINILSVVKY